MSPIEALRAIAWANKVGQSGRITTVYRQEMINIAREVCIEHGVSYGYNDLKEVGNEQSAATAGVSQSAAGRSMLVVQGGDDADDHGAGAQGQPVS